MAGPIERFFNASDTERIAEAVRRVESRTSGEIIPYVVEQSDPYVETIWRAAAIAGAVALVMLSAAQLLFAIRMPLGTIGVGLVTVVAAVIAAASVALVPWLRRTLAGDATIDRRVAARAAEAFVTEEVFATRDRTGVLIFISLFEHRVLILADAGINATVESSAWTGMVRTIVDSIRAGRPADGLIDTIERCSDLLIQNGFVIAPDDVNELPDRLRTGDRR